MKRLYCLALLIALILPCVAIAQGITKTRFQVTKVVVVSVTQAWNSTNFTLQAGDKVDILVTGIASTDGATNPQGTNWIGPDGNGGLYPYSPLPSAAQHSVIGRIGSSGGLFSVGSSVSFTVDPGTSGTLYLGYNDTGLGDNFGYYVAYLIVVRSGVLVTNIANTAENVPETILLRQNYPNPFNPSTNIEYTLRERSSVEIRIYNSAGELVKTVVGGEKDAGQHSTIWDGRDDAGNSVSSGAYFYQLKAGDYFEAKKMLLMK